MYTEQSTMIGYRELNVPLLVNIMLIRPNQQYTKVDFYTIFTGYDAVCREVDINPELVIAQGIHETDWYRSWWSQRPRRNPAGIRVTGETKTSLLKTDNVFEWQWNENTRRWHKGLAFKDWGLSARTHVGHLLNYIYKENEFKTDYHRALSNLSPNKELLTRIGYRGVAKQIVGLNGRWAYPGKTYAQAIAKLANTLFY